jgi:hypothetical protein
MFSIELTNKLKKIPDGQTEDSFITSKIHQINRSIEVFGIVLDDADCFEDNTQISIRQIDMLLIDLLNKMEELKK